MIERRPVIFLDFDGVICSPRAYTAQRERWHGKQEALRWADPVACDFVWQLCRQHHCQIVVSSVWREMEKRARKVLGRYGLDRFLHPDWRTGRIADGCRGDEIAEWLGAHDAPLFLILDDDTDFLPDQLPWHIHTCHLNGMMLADYDKADRLLAAQAIDHRRLLAGHEGDK